jgi:hypothetical protein
VQRVAAGYDRGWCLTKVVGRAHIWQRLQVIPRTNPSFSRPVDKRASISITVANASAFSSAMKGSASATARRVLRSAVASVRVQQAGTATKRCRHSSAATSDRRNAGLRSTMLSSAPGASQSPSRSHDTRTEHVVGDSGRQFDRTRAEQGEESALGEQRGVGANVNLLEQFHQPRSRRLAHRRDRCQSHRELCFGRVHAGLGVQVRVALAA